MSKYKKLAIFGLLLLLGLFWSVASTTATRHDVQGLVFHDNNLNGVWDVGEPGYEGVMQWVEDEELFRNVGAMVKVVTPAYDEYEVETMGMRALEEHEDVMCTQQDLFNADGDMNPNPVRPCAGTWGMPLTAEDTYLQISLVPPEGYYVTSEQTQYCVTGEDELMDFGIAPVSEMTAEKADAAVETEEVTAVPAFHMTVEGSGFIPGLVFIDSNLNGVWDVGEAGYGGQLGWVKETELTRYVGAEITFTSPAYDEFVVESMGYRNLDEDETVICSQQDLVIDGKINDNPLRPCEGTFGLTHAGDDVRWMVSIDVPDGYKLTSANPQYYTTNTGQMPVDFGIVPIED